MTSCQRTILVGLGFQEHDEAIDMAFCPPFFADGTRPDGKTRVGINVSGLLFNGDTGANQFGLSINYASTVREIIRHFAAKHDVGGVFGHVIEPNMPVGDDMRACRQLADEFPKVIVAPSFSRPSEAKSLHCWDGFISLVRECMPA